LLFAITAIYVEQLFSSCSR